MVPAMVVLVLKAKTMSSSEGESECSSDGAEDFGKELALLVRKFHKFAKSKRFRKSSRRDSKKSGEMSSHDSKQSCHKCKKVGHFIVDCP